MEKKSLMVISANSDFNQKLQNRLCSLFDVEIVKNVHSGYTLAMTHLPDLIILDQSSFPEESLEKLSSFKSNHFLSRISLMLYGRKKDKNTLEEKFKNEIDAFLYDSQDFSDICNKIIEKLNSKNTLTNYWKDSFMGLFNLLSSPVILIQNDKILAMNDAFRKAFYVEKHKEIRLSDFVSCENKSRIPEILRNFSRGKHMRASIRTKVQVHTGKLREASVSFSKLDKMIRGNFIMMIQFSENQNLLNENVGTDMLNKEQAVAEQVALTKREKEIIELVCNGYKTREIASSLCVSEKTVEKHRSHIIKKTKSENILESVIYALNHNLIEIQKT